MATLNTTANLTQITAPRVPLIDERTGLVSREWYRFFLSLYNLTGSGQNNTSLTDLQVGPPPAQQEDLTGLVVNIESLKTQPSQESALEQISELEKQIQGLATAIGCACNEVAAELQKQIDALNILPLPNISASLTSGTSILYGNGSGGFSNVSIGSGVSFSGGTLSATGTGGTVTSVSGTAPVVSSGGITPVISLAANYGDTQNPYASKTANFVLAAPNNGAGNPTFRAIVAADIPTLNQNTTGNAATVTTNANLTGAVTSTGNATSLGSFTSAQLAAALTNETGSGAAVFATSPVLVTPALGTPSSGIVTNLTGTASININGTVGATTPAAVTATTVTASGPSASTRVKVISELSGSLFYSGFELYRSGVNGGAAIISSRNPAIGGVGLSFQVTVDNSAEVSATYVERALITSTGLAVTGALSCTGALSKGSGSFRVDHPLPELTATRQLVHSFIEGPKADLIYRGKVALVDGQATVNIDTAATMTEGTFEVLCRDVQCFTTNESDWICVRGKVTGNILTIEAEDITATSVVSWMVIGERQDPHMMETEWTDENGRVIVEPLKPISLIGI